MDLVLDRELDFEDLENTPDDGNRYEILDGAMVITPPPYLLHQRVVGRLTVSLDTPARMHGFEVILGPFAWRIGPGQVPEPDAAVANADAITERFLEGAPVLVIEVLSPTGQRRDLVQKRLIYEEGGAAWYWIVDPAAPSLTVLRLNDGVYEQAAHVVGDQAYETREPIAVRVVPTDLTRSAR